jgi:hypothetical protein
MTKTLDDSKKILCDYGNLRRVALALSDFDNDWLLPHSLRQLLLDSLLGGGESLLLKTVVAADYATLSAGDHVIGLRVLGDRELLVTTFGALEAERVLSHLTVLGVQFP